VSSLDTEGENDCVNRIARNQHNRLGALADPVDIERRREKVGRRLRRRRRRKRRRKRRIRR
jgi:hypothetical protein